MKKSRVYDGYNLSDQKVLVVIFYKHKNDMHMHALVALQKI